MRRLKLIILSKKFLPFVFLFFTLQAVFYASYIGFGIPSDENYHYGSIQYYADQPITTGPFTHNQDPATLPTVRAIDRNPNYLFHYLLSLPLKVMNDFSLSHRTEVVLLRFINTIFALLALYVLKKCLDEISNDKLVKNFTVFLVSMTGMAVWLSGAINYDNLGNLLFLLFVLVTIRIVKKPDSLKILVALVLSMATILTKSTFAPVLLIGVLAVLILVWRNGYRLAMFRDQLKNSLKTKRGVTVLIILTVVIFSGLFVERIGVNLLRYHAVQPDCTKFFKVEECRTFNVFNRNYMQERIYNEADKNSLVKNSDPFSFSGEWIYGMYNTLYFQLGDRRFESGALNQVFAFLLAIVLAGTILLSRAKIRLSKTGGFVLLLSVAYVAILFLYNLHTYIYIGQKYAYQGRYLLPVLGFIYFFSVLLVVSAYKSRKPGRKNLLAAGWLVVLLLFFITHFPPLLLAKETDASWRQEYVLPKEIVD